MWNPYSNPMKFQEVLKNELAKKEFIEEIDKTLAILKSQLKPDTPILLLHQKDFLPQKKSML